MIPVLFQHPHFVVINKPEGVHFHSQDGQGGLVVKLEAQLGKKLYPVHRLDTPTSGLLLLACSSEAAAELSRAFADHKVEKRYLALSDKKPKKKQGWVKGYVAKARRGAWKLTREGEGSPANTQFISSAVGEGRRLYLLRPLSGKTHQIRVSLKSLGAPIVGDPLYGGSLADRTYLHALSLSFTFRDEQHHFYDQPERGVHYLSPLVQATLHQWKAHPPL